MLSVGVCYLYSQTNIFVALGVFFMIILKSHSYPSSTDISFAKALIVWREVYTRTPIIVTENLFISQVLMMRKNPPGPLSTGRGALSLTAGAGALGHWPSVPQIGKISRVKFEFDSHKLFPGISHCISESDVRGAEWNSNVMCHYWPHPEPSGSFITFMTQLRCRTLIVLITTNAIPRWTVTNPS